MTQYNLLLGNRAFKNEEYEVALWHYSELLRDSPELKGVVNINIRMAERSLGFTRSPSIQVKLEIDEKISGGMNTVPINATHLGGWAAYVKNKKAPSHISIKIDNKDDYLVKVNKRRTDLSVVGLPVGGFGFSLKIPVKFYDDKKHEVTGVDCKSGEIVFKSAFRVKKEAQFDDFTGMLIRALVDPMINTPFLEEEKRALAFSDVLVKHWESRVLSTDHPRFSILMPVYNRSEIVGRAINSVISQSYQNWELLVIDDGSTDDTLEVIKKIKDRRINIITLDRNVGKSAALNFGLKQASGEWIAYLDSDNKWHPKYLAASLGAALDRPDVDAFFSGQYLYEGASPSPYAVRLATYNKNLLLNRNYVDHNSFFHKKNVFNKVGFYSEGLNRCVDYEFIIRVSTACKMASLPFVLTDYYFDAVINTITGNQKLADHVDRVIETAQNLLKVSPSIDLYKFKDKKITVVIPSFNAVNDLIKCIESLENCPERGLINIIIVDNNSNQETKALIMEMAQMGRVRAIINDKNYGFTFAVNQGIKISDPNSDIVLLNNDAFVTPYALANLMDASINNLSGGLFVPAQILPSHTKTMEIHVPYINKACFGDVNISSHHANVVSVPFIFDGELLSIKFAPFFCVYIPRHSINKVGLLDAELGRHYRSDRLYCNSVINIGGMEVIYVPNSKVFHGLQKSTDLLKKEDVKLFDAMFKRNEWDEDDLRDLGFSNRGWSL